MSYRSTDRLCRRGFLGTGVKIKRALSQFLADSGNCLRLCLAQSPVCEALAPPDQIRFQPFQLLTRLRALLFRELTYPENRACMDLGHKIMMGRLPRSCKYYLRSRSGSGQRLSSGLAAGSWWPVSSQSKWFSHRSSVGTSSGCVWSSSQSRWFSGASR